MHAVLEIILSNCQVNFLTFVEFSGISKICMACLAGTIVSKLKHNQHVKHAKARWSGDVSPQEILNIEWSEMTVWAKFTV